MNDESPDPIVPEERLFSGTLPPMRQRDLPEPVSLRKMIGPGQETDGD